LFNKYLAVVKEEKIKYMKHKMLANDATVPKVKSDNEVLMKKHKTLLWKNAKLMVEASRKAGEKEYTEGEKRFKQIKKLLKKE
jgi:hypothetical protein